jgi:uncharacterized damage-inducible protein DinB
MMLEKMRTLAGYNAWANGQVLQAATGLTDEQFTATGADGASLRDCFAHMSWAEWNWLHRWKQQPKPGGGPPELSNLAAVRDRWRDVMRHIEAFMMDLDAAALDRTIAYTNNAGEPMAYPLWQMMLQVFNHGTQHRSEAALLLTRLGCSPGQLDFLVYIDQGEMR